MKKIDYAKMDQLRDIVLRGGTPEEADEMIRLSLEADNFYYETADDTLKTLSVCSARKELLPLCLRVIQGVKLNLNERAKRWIVFYAASILDRANRLDLLTDADVAVLEEAFNLEDQLSVVSKYNDTLKRIRVNRSTLIRK